MRGRQWKSISQWAPVVSMSVALCPSVSEALSFNTSLLVGYEVLSYRDDPSKLTGGSVSTGDAFDQTSFTGLAYGFAAQVGLLQTELLEPFVSVDVLNSQLKKSSESDGLATEGNHDFLQAGIGAGGRLWISPHFNVTLSVAFSRSLSDNMKTSKKETVSGQPIGEIEYKVAAHKKTAAALGLAFLPLGQGLSIGADLRLGSGCFECSAESSALQKRTYLTRSGALSVAWHLGDGPQSGAGAKLLEQQQETMKSKLRSKRKNSLRKKKNIQKYETPEIEE